MEEMLIHSSERVQKRLESLTANEMETSFETTTSPVNSAMNTAIGAMHRLIFNDLKPQMSQEDGKINSAQMILNMVGSLNWLVKQFRPLEPTENKTRPSEVYLRLFDASKADTQTLPPARLSFRERVCKDLLKRKSIALIGMGAEAAAMGESVAENLDCLSIRPDSLTKVDELKRAVEEARGKPIVLNGLRWLFESPEAPSESLLWLSKHLHSQTWLIVAEQEVWDLVSDQIPLPSSHILAMPMLTQTDLRAAILSRHQLSGYEINFPNPDHWLTAFRIWSGGGDAEKDWFKQLMKHSKGDLEEAFLLWTEGIDKIDDSSGQMKLGVIGSRYSPVGELCESDLILMRQILKQGWISAELASRWFLKPNDLMTTKLTSIQRMGLLDENQGIWTLSVGVRRPLRQKLAVKGWL